METLSTKATAKFLDGLIIGTGPIAQWLELPAHNRLVVGSSPAGPTKRGVVCAKEKIWNVIHRALGKLYSYASAIETLLTCFIARMAEWQTRWT